MSTEIGNSLFASIDASASGMAAERLRMEVIANNVANANTTKGENGLPFRRKQVVFEEQLDSLGKGTPGVRVVGIEPDGSELPKVYKPNHPHANKDGYVTMPNVVVSSEMIDLMVASRAYEANLNAIKTYQEMANNTLLLLR